jgi:hypothetical protein
MPRKHERTLAQVVGAPVLVGQAKPLGLARADNRKVRAFA